MKHTFSIPGVAGQTKDVGVEIGARETFATASQRAWDMITSDEGLKLWLGDVPGFHLEKGETYQTTEGTAGEVRVVNPGGHLRLTWRPRDWQNASTIQVRVIPRGAKTTISFHQEHLPGAKEREQMRQRWHRVLEQMQILLNS